MRFAKKFLGVFLLMFPLFLTNTINAFETDDDYTPQVTARVARITFLNGDVQIKRNGVENWEKATNNLPLAEGDELTTSNQTRVEIEFDRYNYLRLGENSYLKITTLRDGGIAVSLSQGTMVLRVSKFEKDNEFFEIDAPKTTLAVQKEGMYRIDSGDANSSEIRLTATEKGEARIYSGNSGFTLKNGRSARLYLSGNFEGEWETGDASRYADEFDSWVLERDSIVAKRLRDSNVDKYYDSEITGADDLLEHGQWIYTRKYGYVWKPYSTSTSGYSNWSPYRYGHWRWFPPYGWTWVNDEPWGWATYHYGRWVWDNGGWYWSPYARNRWRRSWWSPALVIVTYSGGYYCWYPLPYNYGYYNYNAYYYNNTTIINNNTTIINNNPTPTQTPRQDGTKPQINSADVPVNAVVAANPNEFGKIVKGFNSPPWQISQNVISNVPTKTPTTPILPNYNQLDAQTTKSVVVATPNIVKSTSPVKTGVIVRETGVSMSDKIQKQKVLDDRTNTPVKSNQTTNNTVRDTGSVTRDEIIKQTQTNTQNQTDRNTTRNNSTQTNTDNNSVRSTGGVNSNQTDRNTTRNNSTNNNNNQQNQTDRNTTRNQQTQQTQQQNNTDRNTQRNQQPQQNNTQRNQTPRNNPQPTQQNQPTQKPREEQKPQQKPQQERKTEQDKDG